MMRAPVFSENPWLSLVSTRLAEIAPSAQLYDWLRENAGAPPAPRLHNPVNHEANLTGSVVQALLQRGDPLIDLGVASFVDDEESLLQLWDRGDKTLRLAIAGNRYRKEFAGLRQEDLVHPDNWEVMAAALWNPSMSSEALADVLLRKSPFDKGTEDEWRRWCGWVAGSPVIRIDPKAEENYWWDEEKKWAETDEGYFDDYMGPVHLRQVFKAAGMLLHRLEPTQENAEMLCHLHSRLSVVEPPIEEYSDGCALNGPQENDGKAKRKATLAFFTAMLKKWEPPEGITERHPWNKLYSRIGGMAEGMGLLVSSDDQRTLKLCEPSAQKDEPHTSKWPTLVTLLIAGALAGSVGVLLNFFIRSGPR